MHHRHHAGDVKHRHDRQNDVFKIRAAPQRRGNCVMHDAGVCVHAALGQASRAAGVRQHSQVLRRSCLCWQVSCAARQRVSPVHHLAALHDRQVMFCTQPVTPGFRHGRIGRRQVKRIAVMGDDEMAQLLSRRQLRIGLNQFGGQITRGNGDFRIRIQDVMLQLFSPIHRVDRNDYSVGTQNRKMRNHPLRAVLHVEHHPVALFNPHACQRRGQCFGLG